MSRGEIIDRLRSYDIIRRYVRRCDNYLWYLHGKNDFAENI